MQAYHDTVQDQNGNIMPTAQITVTDTSNNAVTVYSNNSLSFPITQPFMPNQYGQFTFYAPDGRYTIHVTYNSVSYTLQDVLLEDILAQEPFAALAGSASQTFQVAPATTGTMAVPLAQTIGKNIVIDGGFTINQRAYVSAAALASGSYGHDRWKAGSGGGDYSFTQLASNTTITLAANKTLIQVIEDKNVHGTQYILSWTGTCTARYAVNSATPAGSYAASPIIITGQTAGTTMSIEFGNGASSGTLGKVQLEQIVTGQTDATTFEQRPYGYELALCQRYCYVESSATNVNTVFFNGEIYNSTLALGTIKFPVTMRGNPSLTAVGTYQVSVGAAVFTGTWALNQTSVQTMSIQANITGATAGQACRFVATAADVRLKFEVEL